MKGLKQDRHREIGKNIITDFIRSETGSVGVKNAAALGAFAGALVLSQSSSEAITDEDGNVVQVIIIQAV